MVVWNPRERAGRVKDARRHMPVRIICCLASYILHIFLEQADIMPCLLGLPLSLQHMQLVCLCHH